MGDLGSDVAQAVCHINAAKELGDAAALEYFSACERYDWAAAEDARMRAFAHLEAFFDRIAAVHRRLQLPSP